MLRSDPRRKKSGGGKASTISTLKEPRWEDGGTKEDTALNEFQFSGLGRTNFPAFKKWGDNANAVRGLP